MHYANKFVERLAELDQSGEPFVAVTLVEAVGSTPQDVGAKMLVDRQGLSFGTVGGGRVEQKALALAVAMIEGTSEHSSRAELVQWNLQRDVGMTCGGSVRLFFELFNARRWHIVIFGAGHVAQALIRCLLPLDCHVTCIDQRQEWLERLPLAPNLKTICSAQPEQEVDALRSDDYVVCMTMGHRTDRPILARIFEQQKSLAYLGVIGSQAKRKILIRELIEGGVSPDVADGFTCPIGLQVGTNHPGEIAISIVAQLIQERDRVR